MPKGTVPYVSRPLRYEKLIAGTHQRFTQHMGLPWAANATANTGIPIYLYFIITTSSLVGNYLEEKKWNSIKQCWGSVTFWCGSGSGSPDPYLWLMDLDPNPTLQNQIFFFVFFLITCPRPQAHHIQSKKLNFVLKFCVNMLFCRHYLSSLYTFMTIRKGKEPDPYLWLMDPDPDPDPQHWYQVSLNRCCGFGSVPMFWDSRIRIR